MERAKKRQHSTEEKEQSWKADTFNLKIYYRATVLKTVWYLMNERTDSQVSGAGWNPKQANINTGKNLRQRRVNVGSFLNKQC